MSSRQRKLEPDTLLAEWKNYQESYLTFVLNNKKSVFGKIVKQEDQFFTVRNAMRHQIKLSLQEIQEVWIDEKIRK